MGTTKNLMDVQGINKLKELVESANMCHFVTALDERPLSTRPMSTQQVDDEGNIWFMSQKSSQKNSDIENFQEVQLFYSKTSNSEYLSVYGTGEVIFDRQKIEELWTPLAKAWFNEGKDDPEISLIKVIPEDVHYWDTKNNRLVQLVKIAVGAIAGRPFDDGVEGKIEV